MQKGWIPEVRKSGEDGRSGCYPNPGNDHRAGIAAENPQGCGGTEQTEDLQRIARPERPEIQPKKRKMMVGEGGTPNLEF